MVSVREPILHSIAVGDLRPTQITVGMREVEAKRKAWRTKQGDKAAEFLGRHMIPVILGPKDRHYVIDHHHLARALHDEGVKKVLVTVVANLRRLEPDAFWFVLDNHSWMHPFDDEGRRRGYADIPKSIKDLVDDPFRSLAGELRRVGGFAKDTTLRYWRGNFARLELQSRRRRRSNTVGGFGSRFEPPRAAVGCRILRPVAYLLLT